MPCKFCQSENLQTRPNANHVELFCADCGRHQQFVKQDGKNKTRRNKSTNLATGNYCHLCMRHKSEMPIGVTLEGHHIIEVQYGGSDDKLNIWTLCTECHNLVHWTRKAFHASKIEELVLSLRKLRDQRVTYQDGWEQSAGGVQLELLSEQNGERPGTDRVA